MRSGEGVWGRKGFVEGTFDLGPMAGIQAKDTKMKLWLMTTQWHLGNDEGFGVTRVLIGGSEAEWQEMGEKRGVVLCRVFMYQAKDLGPFFSKTGDKEVF